MAEDVVEGYEERAQADSLFHPLLYLILILLIIGLATIESASYPKTSSPDGAGPFYYLIRQLTIALPGVVVMIGMARLMWEGLLPWLGGLVYGSGLAMMIWAAAAAQTDTNRAWTPGIAGLPPMQPSEWAKIGFVMLAAWLLGRQPADKVGRGEVIAFFALAGAMGAVLVWQKDMGMLMLFGLIVMVMLLIGGLRLWQWLALAAAGAGLLAVGILQFGYRVERVKAWLRPLDYRNGAGDQILLSLIAIARGAVRGCGIGRSPDKWLGLQHPHTDSVFCVYAAETGLWGVMLLVGAYGALAVLSYVVALRAASRTQALLALGCGLAVCIQAAVHMAVTTNLVPAAGLTLPFISYGRSSLIASLLAATAILWVAGRHSRPSGPVERSRGQS